MSATRRISLAQACLLAFLLGLPAHATDLAGKVTSAQGGEPLGKVQVSVVGTTFTAITAKDGTFQIANAPAGKQLLQVSAVGYRSISVAFDSPETGQSKDFAITLLPDNFQRSEKVEVHADIFQSPEWPSVGDMTLTSSELQQTSTVLINDPFRSLQTLPGVSASGNNDLYAQFSVMGAPFEQVGIYVDDVFVPNLLHTVPGTADAPTLSLLTGGDVADMRLMPVAYPVRYADAAGAAVVIRTREGDPSPPLLHAAIGMATSEFLGQGAFGPNKRATWLVGARKSYIGYLEKYFAGTRFTQDGFYDANFKLTYALTPSQTLSLYGTGGQLGINDPHPPPPSVYDANPLKAGASDLAVARLGWKWTASPTLLIDARAAFVRSNSEEDYILSRFRNLDREWSIGTSASWSWRHGAILQAGYSLRRPHRNLSYFDQMTPVPVSGSSGYSEVHQDTYLQNSLQLWHDRVRLQGGLRWNGLNMEREQPITGQFSMNLRVANDTTLEAGWGRYAQFLFSGGRSRFPRPGGPTLGFGYPPYQSSQYIAAVEQRFGERTRVRLEFFDRKNDSRFDFYSVLDVMNKPVFTPLAFSVVTSRDYSRGLQFLLQRRSENRLSGWLGYTFTQARSRQYQVNLPPQFHFSSFNTPYQPTLQDQRHTVNIFGCYRLTPTIRLSAKGLYGSGFPVLASQVLLLPGLSPVPRIGPYERLDLRADKSWAFKRWKLSLYTELLNVTARDNRRFYALGQDPSTKQAILFTDPGFPFVPTAGLGFDF